MGKLQGGQRLSIFSAEAGWGIVCVGGLCLLYGPLVALRF